MSTNSIPPTLRDLYARLGFLTRIRENVKPCIKDMSLVSADSWVGAYKRYRMGESRNLLLNYVEHTVNLAIQAIGNYKDTPFIDDIVNRLAHAKIGIEALKITYHDDPDFLTNIDVSLSDIKFQLDNYKNIRNTT